MDPSNTTCCVFDHGLFVPLALKLAEQFKRVLYYSPWERGFPTLNDAIIGDGYDTVERIDDIWRHKHEIDLFVFPDIYHSGLQLELESQGKLVWGSRTGDEYELQRGFFLKSLDDMGLEVPPHTVCEGLAELRRHLWDKEDIWVKTSKYRGSMETWHWRNAKLDATMLDWLGTMFGPAREWVTFYACDAINDALEVGYDGYCIDGRFPRTAVQGYECKDKGFLCAVHPYDNLPEPIRQVNEGFGPLLGERHFRNFFSSEIRIRGDQFWFTDPCCRCPCPSTEAQLELYGNLGEIILGGAMGYLVEPQVKAKFAAECVITGKSEKGEWALADFPYKLRPFIKCGHSCEIDGIICYPPSEPHMEELAWLVATGDSPKETLETLKERVETLPDGLCAKLESLAELIKEIDDAQAQGIEFTKMQMPEPAEVIE